METLNFRVRQDNVNSNLQDEWKAWIFEKTGLRNVPHSAWVCPSDGKYFFSGVFADCLTASCQSRCRKGSCVNRLCVNINPATQVGRIPAAGAGRSLDQVHATLRIQLHALFQHRHLYSFGCPGLVHAACQSANIRSIHNWLSPLVGADHDLHVPCICSEFSGNQSTAINSVIVEMFIGK
jgi:hypothetical protein